MKSVCGLSKIHFECRCEELAAGGEVQYNGTDTIQGFGEERKTPCRASKDHFTNAAGQPDEVEVRHTPCLYFV